MQPTALIKQRPSSPPRLVLLTAEGRDDQGRDENVGASPASGIRVVLCHPETLVRGSLRALLEQQADIIVTGEAADGWGAVELAARVRPDIVLLDIRLPGIDPLEAIRQILDQPGSGSTRVLVLGPADCEEQLFEVLRAGASALLAGDTEPADLVRGVRVLARGDALLSPGATHRLIDAFVAGPDPQLRAPAELRELTAREREVLTLVAFGLDNHAIAGRLVVTLATVRTHITRTMCKLHAHDRAKLVAIAYESGLVKPRRAAADAASWIRPVPVSPTAVA
ncbi:MAG: response regulator transcription factor [Solirubrobacterales bacterium]|nr:response regulator transcription factor [Solirubrobacterales bacterium]